MSSFTIRISDEKHERLKELAKARGMSLNKLIDELGTIALAEFDAETSFKAMAARGSRARGLELLHELEQLSSVGKRTD